MLVVEIIARFPGADGERIALSVETIEAAIERLNRAFGKCKDGVWTDSLGQEFFIRVH